MLLTKLWAVSCMHSIHNAAHEGIHTCLHCLVVRYCVPFATCSATDIILSGASAGGIGTFNNIDFLARKMKGVRVVGNPWGGWYFPNATTYPQWMQGLPSNFSSKPFYTLYHSYLNQDCVAQHSAQPWVCGPLSVPQMYPYIKTPVYIAENMFDSNQIYEAGQCPREVRVCMPSALDMHPVL